MKIKADKTQLLGMCAIVMVLLCFLSVGAPMNFERQREKREAVVRQRLQKIGAAEAKYLARYGVYAGSFGQLAKEGLLSDSLAYIPFAGRQRFSLRATTREGRSGRPVPAMECGAEYSQYLKGLDESSVVRLTDEANEAGRYPGLKIEF